MRVLVKEPGVEVVAVNDLADLTVLSHLLRYDSVHGPLREEVHQEGSSLLVAGREVRFLSKPQPADIRWGDLGVDLVVECTGRFTGAVVRDHLKSGAPRVIVSAPSEGADLTVVMGVNSHLYDPARHKVVSNASCTTNCLAPIARVIHDRFGIEKGLVTTIHSYTNDQKLLDLAHTDLRRARSAGLSIIPTTTGAALAVGLVLPELAGRLDGVSVRVPTPNVSLADITLCLSKDSTPAEVNETLKNSCCGQFAGILGYSDEPLVSADYLGCSLSAVVDGPQTRFVGGNMVKVSAWYDNEWGYANRLRDLALLMAGV